MFVLHKFYIHLILNKRSVSSWLQSRATGSGSCERPWEVMCVIDVVNPFSNGYEKQDQNGSIENTHLVNIVIKSNKVIPKHSTYWARCKVDVTERGSQWAHLKGATCIWWFYACLRLYACNPRSQVQPLLPVRSPSKYRARAAPLTKAAAEYSSLSLCKCTGHLLVYEKHRES